ncbi:uncharacterized protein DEA37_0011754 [Paragonimus westermani]|uniref:Integrase catalytic domain-containing protein n=1 Tax=Paragonimus westermani TaxID=34504 RepID=A0A5J4NF85_9TREM|nr:uncharacterized protein DEA37_0011754 [Paragonimus westermani]
MEGHMCATLMLTLIRTKLWIIKGLANFRRVITRCRGCRSLFFKPCEQLMASLSIRVIADGYPFRCTVVGCFGPFKVKMGGREHMSSGRMFTSFPTPAIHLLVAHSPSTDSSMIALIRFVGRRGAQYAIYSDNGTNFVGADPKLKKGL